MEGVSAAALRYRVLVGPNQETTVSALLLYAFERDEEGIEQTPDSTMELCLRDSRPESTTEPQDPADYATIIKEIRKQLQDAWKMPEGDRRKFVKRLLLRWHPDKNPDNPNLATKVTQFIFNAVDHLEKGLSIDDEEEVAAGHGAHNYHPWSGSGATRNSWGGFRRDFYDHMNQRARNHRQQRQDFAGNTNARGRHRRRRQGYYAQFHMNPNPQPGEARRWLRQAKADVEAAANDTGCGRCCAFEWACYKYYQV